MSRGQFDARRCKPQICVAGDHEADSRRRAVDRRDYRFFHAELEGEIRIEFRAYPVTRARKILWSARIVGPALNVALKGRGVGTRAKAPAGPSHHHRPNIRIALDPGQPMAILGVHPPGPRIETFWSVQGQGRNPILNLKAGDL